MMSSSYRTLMGSYIYYKIDTPNSIWSRLGRQEEALSGKSCRDKGEIL